MAATWQPARGQRTGMNWDSWLGRGLSIDPYLVWADITNFAGFGGLQQSGERIPILVELSDDWHNLLLPTPQGLKACPLPTGAAASDDLIEFSMFDINGAWLRPSDTGEPDGTVRLKARHVTGQLLPANVPCLLQFQKKVLRFQLGLPRVPRLDRTAFLGRSRNTSGDEVPQVVVGIIDSGFPIAHPQLQYGPGLTRVRYLWDQDECANATPRAGDAWQPVSGHGYGAEIDHRAIEAALQVRPGDPSPHAALCSYRALQYVPVALELDLSATQPVPGATPLAMLASTHGASVVDLAAGNWPPLGNFRPGQSQFGPLEEKRQGTASTAPGWPLVLVQLPSRTSADTSGGSLGVHVLDGVRYIIDRAERIPFRDHAATFPVQFQEKAPDPGKVPAAYANDVVINISYGAQAGPHDGTSILEAALQEMCRRRRRTHIVLAAGNAHGTPSHARLSVTRGGAKRLYWRVGPDNPLESYLEIWLPEQAVNAVGGQSAVQPAAFAFEVRAPGAATACSLRVGQVQQLVAGPGATPLAAAIFSSKVVQGTKGTMVLLVVGPTRPALAGAAPGRATAPHGDWDIEVGYGLGSAANSSEAVIVHAWAERNDLLFGTARAQQSTVWSDDPLPAPTEQAPSVQAFCKAAPGPLTADAPAPFQPAMSFGSLASGAQAKPGFWFSDFASVVAVGGFRASDLEMAAYSGGGPGRGSPGDNRHLAGGTCLDAASAFEDPDQRMRRAPDADAVSDVGAAARGVPVNGMLPGLSGRISGTSAAAPSVTRAIAETLFLRENLLERDVAERDHFFPKVGTSIAENLQAGDTRVTLTPTKDDRFRRGLHRVPRQVAIRGR